MANSLRNYFRRVAEGADNGHKSPILNPLLETAGLVYGGAVGTVRSLYENKMLPRKRLPFPVVSVGNLTWGGTGKTPFVEYLAKRFLERHKTPLILTRGYSKDEVEQMRYHLPRAVIGVGKNRAQVAETLAKQHRIDLAILDDGFQHWPLQRDVEIVMVNGLNPFGNGKLIPRGILREPISVLKRASIVVITNSDLIPEKERTQLKDRLRALAPEASILESYLEPLFFYRAKKRARVPLEKLRNQRVTTFSGVGTPRSFQLILAQLKVRPIRNFEFADHHEYLPEELREIKEVSDSASAEEIITTEKDFFRAQDAIADILNPLILAARLRITSGEHVLTDTLFRTLGFTR